MLCGGASDTKEATPEVQEICDTIKDQLHSGAGKKFDDHTAISYKSQVVAGTNYFVKIHVGNDEFVHVRIFKPLPHVEGGPQLHGHQLGKTRDDPIEYFDSQ